MLAALSDRVRPLRRSEFHQLGELGAFADERVELLDGVLVAMSPLGARHCHAVDVLTELLILALAGRALVRVQEPIAASDQSEPQPDLAVVRREPFLDDHPRSAFLLIEVAESSLAQDRGVKSLIYARAGVPEYWVVDLVGRVIEVHTGPSEAGYRDVVRRLPGEELRPVGFPDVVVPVARVFG